MSKSRQRTPLLPHFTPHLAPGVWQVLYALALVPVGLLADRVDRPRLLAGGIFLWSVLTMAASRVRLRALGHHRFSDSGFRALCLGLWGIVTVRIQAFRASCLGPLGFRASWLEGFRALGLQGFGPPGAPASRTHVAPAPAAHLPAWRLLLPTFCSGV